MKLLKVALGIFVAVTVTSCVSTLPLKQEFYNDKKVGVIIEIDSIGMAKAGSQGLLDQALTPGSRFKDPLQKIEPKINLNETLKKEIARILNQKNKQFVFINEKINNDSIKYFEKPNSDKKYSKVDYRDLKTVHNVDEIMRLKVKYGLLVSYYGAIEINKQGYVRIGSEIVDLNDNSLLEQENFQTVADINGNWKEGADFENLKNSIQEAIYNSLSSLRINYQATVD